MERMINRIYLSLERAGYAKEEDRDVMVYGLDLLLFSIASMAAISVLGIIVGQFLPSFLLLLVFTLLQSFCGGYHAETHLRCFITTLAGWGAGMLLIRYCPSPALTVLLVLGLIINMRIAPLEHVNAPMSENKKKKMQMIGRCLCTGFCVVGFALMIAGVDLGKPFLVGVIMSGISLAGGRRFNTASAQDGLH